MEKFEILSHSPIFKGLAPDDIRLILENAGYQVKHYAKDVVIACREESCDKLMILISGSVKGEMLDFSGKVIKIEDIPTPFPLAPAFIFGHNNRFPVDIVANENAELIVIQKESLLKILRMNEVVLSNFLNIISNRAQFLSQKLYFLSFGTIKEKLANFLLALSNGRNEIVLPDSHHELSELFGVTRPSLSRGLQALEKEGCIIVERRNIKIVNRQKLIEILN